MYSRDMNTYLNCLCTNYILFFSLRNLRGACVVIFDTSRQFLKEKSWVMIMISYTNIHAY